MKTVSCAVVTQCGLVVTVSVTAWRGCQVASPLSPVAVSFQIGYFLPTPAHLPLTLLASIVTPVDVDEARVSLG
jgi:hypothetical protein